MRSQVPDLVHGPRQPLDCRCRRSCSRLVGRDENGPAPSAGGRGRAPTWQLQLPHRAVRAQLTSSSGRATCAKVVNDNVQTARGENPESTNRCKLTIKPLARGWSGHRRAVGSNRRANITLWSVARKPGTPTSTHKHTGRTLPSQTRTPLYTELYTFLADSLAQPSTPRSRSSLSSGWLRP